MSSKRWSALFSVLLSACIGFGGISCMVTAFKMEPVSLVTVAVFCLLFAALLSYWMLGGKSVLVLFGAAIAALILFLSVGGKTFLRSLSGILYRLTSLYHSGYGFPVVGSPGTGIEGAAPFTPGLCVIAGIVILLQTWALCRRRSAIPAVAVAILPLGSCLVVTDTVPANWAIFLLLLGLVLLILTQTVRRRSPADGNRLTAMLLVPVLLLDMLLLGAIPREDYKAQQNQLQQKLSEWFWELPFMPEGPGTGVASPIPMVVEGVEVSLDKIGRNFQSDFPLMYVKADNSGVLYLRGQAYDVYTGSAWQVRKDLEGEKLGWPTRNLQPVQNLEIRSIAKPRTWFFPYYLQRDNWLKDYENGKLYVIGQTKGYIFTQAQPESGRGLAAEDRLTDALYDHYTELPAYTNQQAQLLLSGLELGAGLSVEEKATAIADYVRQTATYDLMTDRMPEGKQDFAIWFLEEASTGYCVHFATAATVLLRAAQIPCRYVTGYLLYTQGGQEVKVTEKQSHAWVEYYDPDIGWRILEPTPSEAQPLPPELTEPTNPSETTEPSETTLPSETTEPPESTGEFTRPPQQTRPTQDSTDDTGGGGQAEKPDRTWILRILMWIGIGAGTVAVLWLQMVLRRRRRHYKMHTGRANAKGLARWREVRRFCRILKETPPTELEELAEKARFSQHKLSAEELKAFEDWLKEARQRLKGKKGRLLYRLFWAV